MNWIKVTKETTLSKGSKILIYTKSGGVKSVTVHSDTGSPLIVSDTGELHFDIPYTLDEYTHYCLISEPVKVEYIEVEGHKITKDILEDILFKSFKNTDSETLLSVYDLTILSEYMFNQLKQDNIKNHAKR